MPENQSPVARRMARIAPPTFTHDDVVRHRDRRARKRRLAAGGVALALFGALAVWGILAAREPGPTPAGESARDGFVRQVGEICQAGQAEFDRLVPLRTPRGNWSLDKKIDYYRTGLGVFEQSAARLRALTPPPGLEGEVDAMLDAYERHLDAVARAVAAGEAGNRHAFKRSIGRAFGPLADGAIEAFSAFDPDVRCP